jgi:histidinol-phosphatase (PHP family)
MFLSLPDVFMLYVFVKIVFLLFSCNFKPQLQTLGNMWSNFHTHGNYCDGKSEMSRYVEIARALKMKALGFSSHAPLPFPCAWCMKEENLSRYLDEITALQESNPNLEIYKGLEIDFVPGLSSPTQYNSVLDYTIGSIHFVDTFPDGRYWEIDGRHSLFLEGLQSIFAGDVRAAITRYYQLTREMITTACPTIVGHLDKIKIQNIDNKLFSEQDSWYQDEVIKTIDAIAKTQAIIEVNTRGIYQKKSTTPYPSPWILKIIKEKNIPITLNSDAHHQDDLTNQFLEMAQLIAEIGFNSITILNGGKWKPFTINTHGITY